MDEIYDANDDGVMADDILPRMPARRTQKPHRAFIPTSKRAFIPTMARTHNPVGRPRKWKDNAERMKAYRKQKALEDRLASNQQDDCYQLLG
jgi:hypothetical protein